MQTATEPSRWGLWVRGESPAQTASRWIAIAMALFHLYTSIAFPLPRGVQRSVHLLFVLALIFLLFPSGRRSRAIDALLGFAGVATCAYVAIFWDDISLQGGIPWGHQPLLAGVLTLVILEATRRTTGWALPSLAIVSLLYGLYGNWIPGTWGHPGFSMERILAYQYLTTDGIWGVPLAVAATVIVMFIILGAFLNRTGIGTLFTDLSMAVAGRWVGGPAQVAVASSALVGTITGSAVANVATTGPFTIPLMKRRGYSPAFAGAVEAVASSGGQIMPPIMGAGAFIMAEFLGVPYLSVVKAALIPAILYFLSIFVAVRFEAMRLGLKREEGALPKAGALLRSQGWLLIPFIVVIWVIIQGASPSRAAFWAIVSAAAVGMVVSKPRLDWRGVFAALEDGARSTVSVSAACACAGIVLGIVSMTGLGVKLTDTIMAVAGDSLALALVMAMVAAIILGMGLPTGVAYAIAAATTAPALLTIGVQPAMAAHMFIFYFSTFGTITPPVCLSVYTAAGISGASWTRTAIVAMKLALPAFLIPYVFATSPSMLLMGGLGDIVVGVFTSALGVLLLAGAAIGYLLRPATPLERIILGIGALGLIQPGLITDLIGLIALGVAIMLQRARAPQVALPRGVPSHRP